jgi:hypothetical protein
MFGGSGNWFYNAIGGIRRTPGVRSWRSLQITPLAGDPGTDLTYADASIDTPVGLVSSAWVNYASPATATYAACGTVEENDVLTLTCLNSNGQPGTGTFSSVAFASFGTPDGSCLAGFTVNASCNSAQSTSVVQTACVGKSTCSVTASNDVFGGDPCLNVPKRLYVALSGPCAAVQYTLSTTVPTGSTATVVVPTVAGAGKVAITESGTGASVPVWANGAFVAGDAGVTGATAAADGSTVSFTVGSGSYAFTVTA